MLWCCSSGPTWDLRHKGPFPPWLRPAWSIKTDTSYNSPTQQLVRAPQWDDPSHSTKWATVHQQLAYSPVLPLVGATESPFSLPIVYKKTLNPDWDEMVFGDSSLPSSWSASLPIIHHSLLQQLVSWFIDLSRGEQNELGLGNIWRSWCKWNLDSGALGQVLQWTRGLSTNRHPKWYSVPILAFHLPLRIIQNYTFIHNYW